MIPLSLCVNYTLLLIIVVRKPHFAFVPSKNVIYPVLKNKRTFYPLHIRSNSRFHCPYCFSSLAARREGSSAIRNKVAIQLARRFEGLSNVKDRSIFGYCIE